MHKDYYFTVLVSGIRRSFSSGERGIRQGDPIAPCIFILCAEYLGKYIHFMSTTKNSGVSIKLTKDSHNFLVDVF